jgi:hypothetical protein
MSGMRVFETISVAIEKPNLQYTQLSKARWYKDCFRKRILFQSHVLPTPGLGEVLKDKEQHFDFFVVLL